MNVETKILYELNHTYCALIDVTGWVGLYLFDCIWFWINIVWISVYEDVSVMVLVAWFEAFGWLLHLICVIAASANRFARSLDVSLFFFPPPFLSFSLSLSSLYVFRFFLLFSFYFIPWQCLQAWCIEIWRVSAIWRLGSWRDKTKNDLKHCIATSKWLHNCFK